MTRITARRHARETGLAAIGQGPRGYDICMDGQEVASVYAKRKGWEFEWVGWRILIHGDDKIERRILKPKGQPGWPMTDEGLEQAKQMALEIVKELYK